MKRIVAIVGLLFLSLLIACETDSPSDGKVAKIDPRDSIIGSFVGYEVVTSWCNATVGYSHDTFPILIQISKSEVDSMVVFDSDPQMTSEVLLFTYRNGVFRSLLPLHAPYLKISNDSLYYYYKGGLGPVWSECFAKKQR